jgi:hypothetical protein
MPKKQSKKSYSIQRNELLKWILLYLQEHEEAYWLPHSEEQKKKCDGRGLVQVGFLEYVRERTESLPENEGLVLTEKSLKSRSTRVFNLLLKQFGVKQGDQGDDVRIAIGKKWFVANPKPPEEQAQEFDWETLKSIALGSEVVGFQTMDAEDLIKK